MNCSEVRDRALLEDWDERSVQPDFEKHLTECGACAEFVKKTRKAATAMKRTEKIPVPEDLWEGIRLRMQKEIPFPCREKQSFLDTSLHYLRFVNPRWAMGIAAGFILIISLTGLPFKINRLPSSHEDISAFLLDSEDEDSTEDFGSDIETYFL